VRTVAYRELRIETLDNDFTVEEYSCRGNREGESRHTVTGRCEETVAYRLASSPDPILKEARVDGPVLNL